MIKQRKRYSVTLGVVLLAGTTVVSAQMIESGPYIGPAIGYYVFDSDNTNNAEDAFHYGLSAGYQFTPKLALELSYFRMGSEIKDSLLDVDGTPQVAGEDLDFNMFRVDGIFNFLSSRWTPYLVIGYTRLSQDPQFRYDEDDNPVDVGLGFKAAITPALSIRSDVRGYFDEHGESDYGVNLGLFYLFGKPPAPPPPPPPPPPEPEPEPIEKPIDPCTLDEDGDGVNNCDDLCPGTPKGSKIETTGCRILTVPKEIRLEILFDSNKAVVKPQYFRSIQEVADFMRKYPSTNTEIQGHTDSRGSEAYNRKLSQRRADAVRMTLVNEFGVAETRLTAVGYGESDPIADNRTAEGRQQNRRVVARIETVVEEVEKSVK
jgi:OOP family OmpA-OmpF porin